MCKTLIYDILMNPLPINDPLRDELNYKRLKTIASELSECFYRAVKNFPIYPEFFSINYTSVENDSSVLRIRAPDSIYNIIEYNEHIWNKFHDECPIDAMELRHAIDISIDAGLTKHYITKKSLTKQFLMDKFKLILSTIPSVHKEHIDPVKPECPKSPGSVSIWKIINIRNNAKLPITKYLECIDEFSLYN